MLDPSRAPHICKWRMSDGYLVAGRIWRGGSDATPILYLHGIQSHGGWYAGSASLLSENGATVILPDRRGSGLNAAARGDVPSLDRWFLDIDEIVAAETGGSERKLDIVGVSWGGKLALAWAIRRPLRVRRLLLIAPGIWPRVDVDRRTRLRIALALFRGGGATFAIPLSDSALFTNNPDGRTFIACDEKKLTHATARFLYFNTHLDRIVRRVRPGQLRVPTTVFLAAADRIIDNERTAQWFDKRFSGAADVQILHGSHSLEFEQDTTAFLCALRSWRDKTP
ncbi:MAG: alpha/beta fold hydrolase [Planctomycetota bacterium]|nr:MAG: alpha/beta fold hydrolase [Planctomycetota bacterium]